MKMKFYDKKHPMKSGIVIASGVALIMAGTWMSMRMMRHHSRQMMSEEESC
ncbi:MAG: hypothetical protein ACYC9O_09575 [Candidatus Latescibacterota bacterium]